MSDGVRRNSPEGTVAEGSRPPADRESKSHEYQIWLLRTGWR
jgi:hypothetical protein